MRRRHQRLFRDYPVHRFRRVFHHTQHNTHNTTHTHHRYLGGHQATKAPTTILRLLCLTFRCVFRITNRSHITTHRAQHRHTIADTVPPPIHTTHATLDTTHHTHPHNTGIILDTKRRRHRRPFRDYSAQMFRCVFRATEVHTSQHIGRNTHHHCVCGAGGAVGGFEGEGEGRGIDNDGGCCALSVVIYLNRDA